MDRVLFKNGLYFFRTPKLDFIETFEILAVLKTPLPVRDAWVQEAYQGIILSEHATQQLLEILRKKM